MYSSLQTLIFHPSVFTCSLASLLHIALVAFAAASSHGVHALPETITARLDQNSSMKGGVAYVCGPGTANVTCINRYGSYLPLSFSRKADLSVSSTGTEVPDDPSYALVQEADFVVLDKSRGLALLGLAPQIQRGLIPVLNVIHEAPIFVLELNKLFVTQDGPPGNLSILALDLSHDPPTISLVETDPPIYQPTGGNYNAKDGMIYYGVQGKNASLPGGLQQHAGVARVDPVTLKAEWLVNNYFGFNFAGPNDLTIDAVGDIWFTGTDYACVLGLSDSPKQLQLSTWRFRPSTGQIQVMDTSLSYPNGIAFSRDGRTWYIVDLGLESYRPVPTRGTDDFGADGTQPVISGKRVIFPGAPDEWRAKKKLGPP